MGRKLTAAIILGFAAGLIFAVAFLRGPNHASKEGGAVLAGGNPAARFEFSSVLQPAQPPEKSESKTTGDYALVKRVVDGDTIEIEGGEKVRYIGVNAPEDNLFKKEIQCFGRESKEENKRLVEGKTVRLEKDASNRDKYGRLLRYVYLLRNGGDGGFVNKLMIERGFAVAWRYPPDVKYSADLKKSQEAAQSMNLGLWAKCRK